MLTLGLCMIVKNEEDNLERCLSSCHTLFDEIVIVDTGSTDATVRVASRYTDKLYYFKWVNDFAAARNYSFSKATMDYIMWLDADDTISPEDHEKMARLKEELSPDVDVVGMVYNCAFDDDGNVTLKTMRDRWVKRSANLRWAGKVHEQMGNGERVLSTEICVNHFHKSEQDRAASLKRNFEILEEEIHHPDVTLSTLMYYVLSLHTPLERYDECIRWYEKFIQRADKEQPSLSFIGVFSAMFSLYKQIGDLAAAAALLTKNKARLADKAEYYCWMGEYYADSVRDLPLAATYYTRALSCTGKEPNGEFIARIEEYYFYLPHISLARINIFLNKFTEGLYHAAQALTYKPNDKDAAALYENNYHMPHLEQAYACVSNERFTEALYHVEQVLTHYPDDQHAQTLLPKIKRLVALTSPA